MRFLCLFVFLVSFSFCFFIISGEAEGLKENTTLNSIQTFITKTNRQLSSDEVSVLAEIIYSESKRQSIDYRLLCAVIAQESRFRYDAVSEKGAQGLGQLMPTTAKGLGVVDPFNPYDNIHGTSVYLKRLLSEFGGNRVKAIAAYYQGPNSLKRRGVYSDSKDYVLSVVNFYDRIQD